MSIATTVGDALAFEEVDFKILRHAVASNRRELANNPEWNQTLIGAGVGLEFVFKGRARARVDWARGIYQDISATSACVPATCPQPDDIDPSGRFHFLFSLMY